MNAQIINKIVSTAVENNVAPNPKFLEKLINKKMVKATTPEKAMKEMESILVKYFGESMDEDMWDDEWKENLEMWLDTVVIQEEFEDAEEFNEYQLATFKFIKEEMNVNVLTDYSLKDEKNMAKNNFMIKGPVQSGKTKTLLAHALASTVCGVRNVFIVRNISEDKCQLINAMERYTMAHQKYVRDECFQEGVSLKCVDIDSIGSWINPRNEVRNIVLLANGSQLSKFLEETREMKYNIFVDEADQMVESAVSKEVAKSLSEQLKKLYANANKTFSISATTFALQFKEDFIAMDNTLFVNTPSNYHGVDYLIHQEVVFSKVEGENDVVKAHPGLIEAISTINKKSKPLSGAGLKGPHPHILLAKVSMKKDDHTCIVDHIYNVKKTQKKWATIIFNGEGVEIGHHSLKPEEMMIDTVEGKLRKGCCYTFKGLGIQKALSFLKKNGGVERFSKVLIASGKMADRGINFVSDDYEWSITDQYLYTAKTTTGASTIQALRILGCHNDNMNRTLWCSKDTYENIQKYHTLDQSLIEAGKKQNGGMSWDKFCESVKVQQKRMPGMKLCKGKSKIKVVVDKTNDNLVEVEVEWNGDSAEKRGLEAIRNNWGSKTGARYNIINIFQDNDWKSLSKEELNLVGNLDKYLFWGGKTNSQKDRVKLMIKNGDRYNINNKVVKYLGLI